MSRLRGIKSAVHGRLIRVGIDIRRLRLDRKVLERRILTWVRAKPEYRRILFVGCDWYTQHYPWLFRTAEFWTLERDPGLARYGAPTRHIIGSCEDVAESFGRGGLDCVICNGVYGFGLDSEAAVAQTIAGFRQTLRPASLLFFGWNNVPEHDPLGLATRDVFEGFAALAESPLGSACQELPTRNRHTYQFLVRQ